MAEVIFYHQERVDGGQRSGLTVDGETVLHSFVEGSAEFDPALEWYADVAIQTPLLPTPANARDWLRNNSADIRESLIEAASRFASGIDPPMPVEFVHNNGSGSIRVTVSAMRRLVGRAIGERLKRLAGSDFPALFTAPSVAN
jgi:hypothetical protein